MPKWVTMWANAISICEQKPEGYARNISLRYPIHAPLDGSAIRLTLDNFCGTEDVCISAVSVGYAEGDPFSATDLECPCTQAAEVTFGGSREACIPAGERVTSDPARLPVRAGEALIVTVYFGHITQMRSAVLVTGPLSRGYFTMEDATQKQRLDPEITKVSHWVYFLSDIQVLTDEENETLVCYGDSITAQSWPDYLAQKEMPHLAVVRKAVSGTRVLRQYSCISYHSYGLMGSIRFPHEFPVAGAGTVLIQQGINDIIHPVGVEKNRFRPMSDLPTAQELIEGLRYYIRQARGLGMRVGMGTLLPIEGWRTYAPFREELRNAVNEWIRSTDEIDFCVDFDRALCDPQHPAAFAPGFDSGDHLHPSERASAVMADEAYAVLRSL